MAALGSILQSNNPPSLDGGSAGILLKNVPCDASVYVGAAVKMVAGVAYNALADSLANSNVIGCVQAKPSTTTCDIRVTGKTIPAFVGLDETKEYFLSDVTPGLLTVTAPTSSGTIVLKLGQPFSSTEFVFYKGERFQRA